MQNGGAGIFIDGIHGGTASGFSPVSEKTVEECENCSGMFRDLKALLFTHCHDDHYDPEAVDRIRKKTNVFFYAPGQDCEFGKGRTIISGIPPFEIFAIATTHDGKAPLCDEPHVSYIINTPDDTFFAPGDAVFNDPSSEAAQILSLCRHRIKAAFVNPYQILLDCNREFLKKLDPESAVLIHHPLPKDDRYNANILFSTALRRYPDGMPKLVQADFYSFL